MGSTATTKTATCGDGTTIACDRAGSGSAIAIVGGGPTDRTAKRPVAVLLGTRFTIYHDDRRGESGDIGAYTLERECHHPRRAQ